MPRIVLKDLETERTITIPDSEATLGRDPACSILPEGPKSKVVSGHHARVFYQDDAWWIEDTSRNGTVLDDERLRKGERHTIKPGQILGLGETGRLRHSLRGALRKVCSPEAADEVERWQRGARQHEIASRYPQR